MKRAIRDFEVFGQDERLREILDDKNRIIMTQEKDIGYLKRQIAGLKSEIDYFQNKKK